MGTSKLRNGIVKWFNEAKGYGFIDNVEPENRDIFFHITYAKDGYKPTKGDKVRFILIPGNQKPLASEVELVK